MWFPSSTDCKSSCFNTVQQSPTTKKIFVGGVSLDTTEDDVRGYFGTYGTVSQVNSTSGLYMKQILGNRSGLEERQADKSHERFVWHLVLALSVA